MESFAQQVCVLCVLNPDSNAFMFIYCLDMFEMILSLHPGAETIVTVLFSKSIDVDGDIEFVNADDFKSIVIKLGETMQTDNEPLPHRRHSRTFLVNYFHSLGGKREFSFSFCGSLQLYSFLLSFRHKFSGG